MPLVGEGGNRTISARHMLSVAHGEPSEAGREVIGLAVIQEFETPRGVHISIRDDAIAGVPPEEMDRRIREVRRTAWRIWEAQHARKIKKEGKNNG